jgi:hypothetical protein
MLSVTNKQFMLSLIILNMVMLSAVLTTACIYQYEGLSIMVNLLRLYPTLIKINPKALPPLMDF